MSVVILLVISFIFNILLQSALKLDIDNFLYLPNGLLTATVISKLINVMIQFSLCKFYKK